MDPNQSLAQALIDGQPVQDFSQEEVETIRSDLEKEKEKTIKEGNTEKLKLIQKILANIDDISTATQQKKKNHQLPPIKQPTNEEKQEELRKKVEQAANENDVSIIQGDEISDAINISKQIIKEKSEKRELLEAQKYQDLYDSLLLYRNKTRKVNKESAKLNDLDSQINNLEETLREAKDKRDKAISEFDNQTNTKLSEMQQQNEDKYNNYDQETQEKVPQSVTKPSPMLLDLRARANHLINSHRFAEAHNYDVEAQKLEEKELESAKKSFLHARSKQKSKIMLEDNNKINIYLQKRQNEREEMLRNHNHQIYVIEKTIGNLDSQKTDKPKPKIAPIQTTKSRQLITPHLLMPLGRRPQSAYSLSRPRSQNSFGATQ
ncbi:hypothetical protein TVAG_467290 [Trichomonas vaginalis G3]|uniref:Uncharacterized protein n=1 Tax=Trichomonas vaginalis (strain ATCC PRA-98 / G3) TaxID=412133 RepID=A2FQD5_TRIV3|nr:hypothetical protein TVAGG3_1048060 [Trichomonas vaginalis G3]EAX92882.1 hypothetical protein TVAG_467290 [Trichomonas vaginalis G3]KAI5494017.1 hypothetical protein TVAGG3_1048060 [Trichomonas vaginalis G3]|eukprot:XP_001305812.1 hypothetical protein [Trichomonas vaginalis G3]